ncbi:MAG: FG-GAP repeat protein [Planctomycetes bacterium]|nr:FG-GAP repeat protein [Planctomycetota bacterium]
MTKRVRNTQRTISLAMKVQTLSVNTLVVLLCCPIAFLLAVNRSLGQCSPNQIAKLIASDAGVNDLMGNAVAVSGQTVIIGDEFDDRFNMPNSGSAYVFVQSGSQWTEQTKLLASDGAAGDLFGWSVAVSGNTTVVSAVRDDNSGGSDAGAAYVFVRPSVNWNQQAKLLASDGAADDWFGTSVAISGDTIVVGSYLDNSSGGTDAGSAYVFVRNAGVWTQQAKLTAADGAPNNHFGNSVAISGETSVIGAPEANAAYVFVRSGSVWTQQAKLTAADPATNDQFGTRVAVSGDIIIVGAPFRDLPGVIQAGSAYIFVRTGALWNQEAQLFAASAAAYDRFGDAVALFENTAVIGAFEVDEMGATDAGAAFAFIRSGAIWTEQAKLVASDAASGDYFGFSVALSGDITVIGSTNDSNEGAIGAGAAYVYDLLSATHPGDMDGDHDVDGVDMAIFVEVLIGVDVNPAHVLLADLDCSGVVDGLDIQPFADVLLS